MAVVYDAFFATSRNIPLLNPAPKRLFHSSLQSDLPVLEKEVTDATTLPDTVRSESPTVQLMGLEEYSQYPVATVGDVLTVRQLIFYRGMALAAAVAALLVGIFIRVFQ